MATTYSVEEIGKKVHECVRTLLADNPAIETTTRLVEDLGLDSLDSAMLVLELDDAFPEIVIEICEDENWKTVGDIIAACTEKLRAQSLVN